MYEERAVQIARPASDRVPAAQIVGIALICAGAGIALSYGLASPSAASDAWTPVGAAFNSAESLFPTRDGDDSAVREEDAARVNDEDAQSRRGRVLTSPRDADRERPGSSATAPTRGASSHRGGSTNEWWALMGARATAPRSDEVVAPAPRGATADAERSNGRGASTRPKRGRNASGPVRAPGETEALPQNAATLHARAVSYDLTGKPIVRHKLQRGPVTYLRCDGARRSKRSNQCPRERRLEAGVWKALDDLARCRLADPGTGRAQLKLTLKKRAAPVVEVGPPETGSGLNLRAVNKCALPDLARLRPRLRAVQAVITFSFGLN